MALEEKQRRQERRKRLDTDFEFFAEECLKIRTKAGEIVPFIFNEAQLYLHEQVERQIEKTGRVRAIILKGRQLGLSTYIEARLFWKVTRNKGLRAFILTHEAEATKNLFEMSERFYQYCPESERPELTASNAKELDFRSIDSGYRVGTAGNKDVGRSSTIQLLHSSEVAFWSYASRHAKGIFQAVPDAEGTEIYLESTANGIGNYFHEQWQLAETEQSEYQAIFIPWHWQQEYRAKSEKAVTLSPSEGKLKSAWRLDDEQIIWRRKKIAQLTAEGKRGEDEFKQEYPFTPVEAFEAAGDSIAFEKLSRERHMLRPFRVPDYWTKFSVIDWGTAKPFAVGWFCVCDEDLLLKAKDEWPERLIPKGALILYREWYGWAGRPDVGCRMESPEVARQIIAIEESHGEEMDFRVGDSAMWAQHDGPSVEERMYQATDGLYKMEQCRKDRVANYQEFRARIEGEDGVPMFYAAENCKHFWRTVPPLKLDELHPEKGPDSSQEDHIGDCVFYSCAARPFIITLPEREKAEKKRLKRKLKKKGSYY